MRRPLPTADEAVAILKAKRTRPPVRPPPPAGRGLTKTLKALEETFGNGPRALQTRWKEIVGEAIARRSEPVKLVRSKTGGATLDLRVEGPAAALLQHQSGQILQRLNLYLGEGTVTRLRIVQGPVRGYAAARQPAPRRRKSGPLDAAAEAELASSVAEVRRDDLREQLTRLGREVLRGQDR
jgi:hypothetical protein